MKARKFVVTIHSEREIDCGKIAFALAEGEACVDAGEDVISVQEIDSGALVLENSHMIQFLTSAAAGNPGAITTFRVIGVGGGGSDG
jgi:hypothetical protein